MRTRYYAVELQFNNGDKIPIEKNDITIFVGSNNVGKTTAIKNIYDQMTTGHNTTSTPIIKRALFKYSGTFQQFAQLYSEQRKAPIEYPLYIMQKSTRVTEDEFKTIWSGTHHGSSIFINENYKYLSTLDRISGSDPVNLFDSSESPSAVPLHFIFRDSSLEREINKYFNQAFDQDLILNRQSGKKAVLHVGKKPVKKNDDEELTTYYGEINKLPRLDQQGDGMRSFASILLQSISSKPFVVFIDEPESFLHPAQARLLGKFIGKHFNDVQVFISTHSSDFIKGLMESGSGRTNIVRIQRQNALNIPFLLDNNGIQAIWNDSIMRHSPIIDGLFHEKVIICEADGDCRLFSALLESEFENTHLYPHITEILFIPAHSKNKISKIAISLKKLSVPTYCICDFDVLNDSNILKELVTTFGGDWNTIKPQWQLVKKSIEEAKHFLNKEEIKKEIISAIDSFAGSYLTTKEADHIKQIVRVSTAWSKAKSEGLNAIPPGEAYNSCVELLDYLAIIGIFPIKVGELESFDKTLPSTNKSIWLDSVLQKDFKNSKTLPEAKKFITEVVNTMYQIE